MGSKKILIIDDDDDIRSSLVEALAVEGYEVLEATNGAEALHILTRNYNELPSMILLDLQMPVMDGATFLKEIQIHESSHLKRIPIVVATAKGSGIDLSSLPHAVGKIPKPMDLDEIYSLAEKYCKDL